MAVVDDGTTLTISGAGNVFADIPGGARVEDNGVWEISRDLDGTSSAADLTIDNKAVRIAGHINGGGWDSDNTGNKPEIVFNNCMVLVENDAERIVAKRFSLDNSTMWFTGLRDGSNGGSFNGNGNVKTVPQRVENAFMGFTEELDGSLGGQIDIQWRGDIATAIRNSRFFGVSIQADQNGALENLRFGGLGSQKAAVKGSNTLGLTAICDGFVLDDTCDDNAWFGWIFKSNASGQVLRFRRPKDERTSPTRLAFYESFVFQLKGDNRNGKYVFEHGLFLRVSDQPVAGLVLHVWDGLGQARNFDGNLHGAVAVNPDGTFPDIWVMQFYSEITSGSGGANQHIDQVQSYLNFVSRTNAVNAKPSDETDVALNQTYRYLIDGYGAEPVLSETFFMGAAVGSETDRKTELVVADPAISESAKAVVDGYTEISDANRLYDRAVAWAVDNPDKERLGARIIAAIGSTLDLGDYGLVIDPLALVAFAVDTGARTITIDPGVSNTLSKAAAFDRIVTTGVVSFQNGGSTDMSVTDANGTQAALTLTGLQPASEVRVYDAGTAIERGGVESSGTVFTLNYTHTADFNVDIVIIALGFLNQRIEGVALTADGATAPVRQTPDRQYANP